MHDARHNRRSGRWIREYFLQNLSTNTGKDSFFQFQNFPHVSFYSKRYLSIGARPEPALARLTNPSLQMESSGVGAVETGGEQSADAETTVPKLEGGTSSASAETTAPKLEGGKSGVRAASCLTFGQDPARNASRAAVTTSKVMPFSGDELTPAAEASKKAPAVLPQNDAEAPAVASPSSAYFGDFGVVVTTAIKAKSWATHIWRGFLLLCATGTFAILETTNRLLLGVCGAVFASIFATTAYEAHGNTGLCLVLLCCISCGVGAKYFTKEIGMMEVWSQMFEDADMKIGLAALKREQLELHKKRTQETVRCT